MGSGRLVSPALSGDEAEAVRSPAAGEAAMALHRLGLVRGRRPRGAPPPRGAQSREAAEIRSAVGPPGGILTYDLQTRCFNRHEKKWIALLLLELRVWGEIWICDLFFLCCRVKVSISVECLMFVLNV